MSVAGVGYWRIRRGGKGRKRDKSDKGYINKFSCVPFAAFVAFATFFRPFSCFQNPLKSAIIVRNPYMDTPALPTSSPAPVSTSAVAVLERFAMPYLLFSGFLAFGLLLSWLFLLPRFAAVEVNGERRTTAQITAHRNDVLAKIRESEEVRQRHVLSVDDASYTFLKTRRAAAPAFAQVHAEARAQAGSVAQDGAVEIERLVFDAVHRTLQMQGDIHSVGSRSMTVLAAFADAIARSPSIASLAPPVFNREDDPKTGPHSPFDFQATLR